MVLASLLFIKFKFQAGISDEKLVEAHGAFNTGHCIDCRKEYSQVLPINRMKSNVQSQRRVQKKEGKSMVVFYLLPFSFLNPFFIEPRMVINLFRPGSKRESWWRKTRRRFTFVPLPIFVAQVPRCTLAKCGGVVKPDIVFFGENLPERFFQCVSNDFKQCDLLIVLGTRL